MQYRPVSHNGALGEGIVTHGPEYHHCPSHFGWKPFASFNVWPILQSRLSSGRGPLQHQNQQVCLIRVPLEIYAFLEANNQQAAELHKLCDYIYHQGPHLHVASLRVRRCRRWWWEVDQFVSFDEIDANFFPPNSFTLL